MLAAKRAFGSQQQKRVWARYAGQAALPACFLAAADRKESNYNLDQPGLSLPDSKMENTCM